MDSWHTEQQDGGTYYMPQCEVCSLRYDEYGLYADKEQAVTDAVNDGWQACPDLYRTDWECRCPAHWTVRCEVCDRHAGPAPKPVFDRWLFGHDDDMSTGVCDQCVARIDTLPALQLGSWPIFYPSHQRRDKWQALKVLEEASELVEAVKQTVTEQCETTRIGEEVADLLQTVVNLCAAFDINTADLRFAQTQCALKNLKRGMFDDTPRTHMHREQETACEQ